MKARILPKSQTSKLLAAAILTVLCKQVSGVVIPDTQIVWTYDTGFPGANYIANTNQAPTGINTTAVFFDYTGTTIQAIAWNVDEESDWYVANLGDNFSAATIAANQFPIIFTVDNARPPVSIPLGDFYLAVNTGTGDVNSPTFRNVFGWLELDNTGTQLLPVANAVAYGEQGIYIGTTNAVPEPASAALLLLPGLALLVSARRRNVQHPE